LVVATAGNEGPNIKACPASYESALIVGAVNKVKIIASFSQNNDQVELVAPGAAVKETIVKWSW
jgi:subtilisin family serine protease